MRALIVRYAIACDLRTGVIEALHKPALMRDAAEALVEALNGRYGYDRATLLDRDETVAALGSRDASSAPSTIAAADISIRSASPSAWRAAAAALGAAIHERTPALVARPRRRPARAHGSAARSAPSHVIVATDGRSGRLRDSSRARRMVGVNSFIVGDRAARRARRGDPARRGIGRRQPLRRALLAQDAPTAG